MIIEKLRTIVEELEKASEDAQKCEDGNASAGRRVRKISMDVIKKLKDLRSEILENIR
jgi:hypothetical protein